MSETTNMGGADVVRDGDRLPLPTGPRPDPDRLAWMLSGMPKVGRTSVDLHVFDGLRAEVNALRARLAEVERERDEARTDLAEERQSACACRVCGYSGPGFRAYQHPAGDYDVACPQCQSDETSESAADALGSVVSERDDAEERAERAEADLAAEREARQRAEARVAGLAAALLAERGEHHDRLCAWVLSEGACDCHYGHLDAALTDARPALDAAIEEATRPLREQVAGLAAALNEALDGWEDAFQYKGEYLAKKHGDAEDIARLRLALTDAAPVLAAHVERETAAALISANEKDAEPYTCDSRGVEASGCNDPYGRCTLCPRNREADRE